MKTFKNITSEDLVELNKLIYNEKREFNFFFKLGWNYKSIENHLKKNNNFSVGCFFDSQLCGILLGEKIYNNSHFDLEVHIMFVSKHYRRNKIGTKMLNYIEINRNITKISKLFLEVSENNMEAIKFYEKNNFVFFNFRHNYYRDDNKNINAKCYSKII